MKTIFKQPEERESCSEVQVGDCWVPSITQALVKHLYFDDFALVALLVAPFSYFESYYE
jgi:hypothetical protein